ncbi:MAG: type 2 isopentenyl-diphosphate Delta-isomerase [Candidatus Pacebacteria bacterium]|nr:type 2 isopentenyl-diphosphate Delta-isomerase [Candidatus Paceibacterota bacterium]
MISVEKRKQEHIEICLRKDVNFTKTNGFEKYDFVHNALCDFDFSDIDLSCEFFGKQLKAPIVISSITGGCEEAERINLNLATAAQKLGIAMSCGSQKAMIKNPECAYTYGIRSVAPDILYLGNIGLDYLKNHENFARVKLALKSIGGDGIFVHLNLAQELSQREGERDFAGSYDDLADFVKFMDEPVLVKEVGAGISSFVAKRLEKAGVAAIDVAGAGGTSWTKVEGFRQKDGSVGRRFGEWGIPTADCLVDCLKSVQTPLIASGGIYDGITACKALAMGASLIGVAGPLLRCANESTETVQKFLENYILEMKICMMLVGCRRLEDLREKNVDILKR